MTTTLNYTPKEVEELIRKQLLAEGFEVAGPIRFEITPGSNDPRERSGPGLSSVSVPVKKVEPFRDNVPANLRNGY